MYVFCIYNDTRVLVPSEGTPRHPDLDVFHQLPAQAALADEALLVDEDDGQRWLLILQHAFPVALFLAQRLCGIPVYP